MGGGADEKLHKNSTCIPDGSGKNAEHSQTKSGNFIFEIEWERCHWRYVPDMVVHVAASIVSNVGLLTASVTHQVRRLCLLVHWSIHVECAATACRHHSFCSLQKTAH